MLRHKLSLTKIEREKPPSAEGRFLKSISSHGIMLHPVQEKSLNPFLRILEGAKLSERAQLYNRRDGTHSELSPQFFVTTAQTRLEHIGTVGISILALYLKKDFASKNQEYSEPERFFGKRILYSPFVGGGKGRS